MESDRLTRIMNLKGRASSTRLNAELISDQCFRSTRCMIVPTCENIMQDLSKFRVPPGFRGRSAIYVQLWWLIQSTLFRWSPQFLYPFRSMLLRAFGAKVGRNCIIRPSAVFTYPWKIVLGDNVWVGDDVVLYSLDVITIGSNSVISQRSYLCAGDHDYRDVKFSILGKPIHVGSQVWIATDVFVAPGVKIGDMAVIGARSTVISNLSAGMVCFGHPCREMHMRDSAGIP